MPERVLVKVHGRDVGMFEPAQRTEYVDDNGVDEVLVHGIVQGRLPGGGALS